MALISCSGAAFAYDSGRVVLSGLDFSVSPGDYLCVIGENGSGKTTLIKGLLKLIKPVKGEIVYGENLSLRDVGYLPQQTDSQKDFPASVYEVALSGCLSQRGLRRFYSKTDKLSAMEKLSLLGVEELKDACFKELSGGQQRRVLLARALCSGSRLLIMDEPAAGLDPAVTLEMYWLIKTLNQGYGITIVMVSHDLDNVFKYASHILWLRNSQLFFGGVGDYLRLEDRMQ